MVGKVRRGPRAFHFFLPTVLAFLYVTKWWLWVLAKKILQDPDIPR